MRMLLILLVMLRRSSPLRRSAPLPRSRRDLSDSAVEDRCRRLDHHLRRWRRRGRDEDRRGSRRWATAADDAADREVSLRAGFGVGSLANELGLDV